MRHVGLRCANPTYGEYLSENGAFFVPLVNTPYPTSDHAQREPGAAYSGRLHSRLLGTDGSGEETNGIYAARRRAAVSRAWAAPSSSSSAASACE